MNTIRWHLNGKGEGVDIPFDNVPFCWVGRKYLVCQFGKRKTSIKEKVSKTAICWHLNGSGEGTDIPLDIIHSDSSGQLHRCRIMQYCCGYFKFEYR